MSTNRHERPGVYSSYDASSVVSGGGSGGTVGLAAVSEAEAGKVYTLSRYEDAVSQLGAGDRMTGLVRLLFLNGAAQVKAVAVAEESGYEGAFALLQGEEEIAVVVCDSTALAVQQKLRASVEDASAARRERIAVVSGAPEETVSEMVERAEALNSERVVLVAPGGGDEVAAVAGAIAGERDPAVPLGGAVLRGVEALTRNFDDGELDGQCGAGGDHPDQERRGGRRHLAGADHHSDCGRRDSGGAQRPAGQIPAGQKYRAEPGGHSLSGGAGAGE